MGALARVVEWHTRRSYNTRFSLWDNELQRYSSEHRRHDTTTIGAVSGNEMAMEKGEVLAIALVRLSFVW